ncbi:MAG: hypothetical protein IIU80_04450 [Clostridia bacterium]|jgi:hypothetical protein|nr:hypothetical protein [Clostridia bacterium]
MIYFRPIASIEEAKNTLEKKTEIFKPPFSVYEEGLYSKQYKNFFNVMYENGDEIDSVRGHIRPHFYGFFFSFNEREYLLGLFYLDWFMLMILAEAILFIIFSFDFEALALVVFLHILVAVFNIKEIKELRNFLDTL